MFRSNIWHIIQLTIVTGVMPCHSSYHVFLHSTSMPFGNAFLDLIPYCQTLPQAKHCWTKFVARFLKFPFIGRRWHEWNGVRRFFSLLSCHSRDRQRRQLFTIRTSPPHWMVRHWRIEYYRCGGTFGPTSYRHCSWLPHQHETFPLNIEQYSNFRWHWRCATQSFLRHLFLPNRRHNILFHTAQ